ncbi:MAG: VIT1/CCC1 transporter family protein [Candidatus Dormibacteria bacterium]|jgi:VIT1/CCC1 family predicted Fe2+/Mn2+ transporter
MASTEEREPDAEHPGLPEPRPEHHRDIQGGTARAAVFGVSDGLLTNVSLILGVAGASPTSGLVRLAGMAGLVAGAISMAAGEYISMTAQRELIHREVAVEREELRRNPELERRELVAVYLGRGVPRKVAEDFVGALMQDPEVALAVHAREELGIDPSRTGSPTGAALSSFVSFAIGALIPLLPWFFATGWGAVLVSIGLGAVAAVAIGAAIGYFSERSVVHAALRQLLITAGAAAVTFGVGRVVGVGVTTAT